MAKRIAQSVCLLVASIVTAASLQAQAPIDATLKGLRSVYVVAEEMSATEEAVGLRQNTLRELVEETLPMCGVAVTTAEQAMRTGNDLAYLYLRVHLFAHPTPRPIPEVYSFTVSLELAQAVVLVRTGSPTMGRTWAAIDTLGTTGGLAVFGRVRDTVHRKVGEFCAAHKLANPTR